jgi:hypothetical protein
MQVRSRKAVVLSSTIRAPVGSNADASARRNRAGERQALHEQSERKSEVNEPHVFDPGKSFLKLELRNSRNRNVTPVQGLCFELDFLTDCCVTATLGHNEPPLPFPRR